MRGNPLPESCVGLSSTFCTGWILKKRFIKLVFPQKRQKSKIPDFFFNDTATTEIYTLSLHDALPIYFRITRLGFNFGVPKNIKLRRTRSHMKDTAKSSSGKFCRVVYYLVYRTDPQKTHYKISFSAKISTTDNSVFFSIKSPPNSRSTAL